MSDAGRRRKQTRATKNHRLACIHFRDTPVPRYSRISWPITAPFNGLFFKTTWVSRYQKGKTSLDLNEARDDGVLGLQWHQYMQTICTSLQTDSHTSNVDPGVTAKYYPPDWSYLLGKNWQAQIYLPGKCRLAKSYPAQPVVTLLSHRRPSVFRMNHVSGTMCNV